MPHQHGHHAFGLSLVDFTPGDRKEAAGIRVQGGFSEFRRAHLTQALESSNGEILRIDLFLRELLLRPGEFPVIQAVDPPHRAASPRRHIHTEERRHGHIYVPCLNKSREMPEEKREKKHLNMRPIDVRVSKNADLAVAEV